MSETAAHVTLLDDAGEPMSEKTLVRFTAVRDDVNRQVTLYTPSGFTLKIVRTGVATHVEYDPGGPEATPIRVAWPARWVEAGESVEM